MSHGFMEVGGELDGLSSIKQIDLDDLGRISLDLRRPRGLGHDDDDDMDEPVLMGVPGTDPSASASSNHHHRSTFPSVMSNVSDMSSSVRDTPPALTTASSMSSANLALPPSGSGSAVRRSGTYQSITTDSPMEGPVATSRKDADIGAGNGGYRELRLDDEEDPQSASSARSQGISATLSTLLNTIKASGAGAGAGAIPVQTQVPTQHGDRVTALGSQPEPIAQPNTTSMRPESINDDYGDVAGKAVTYDDEDGWNRFRRAMVNMQFMNAGNLCGANNNGCSIQ
ncbi:hypothetical protein HDU96_004236 [Phlyctochytrium bullatum]|nr:hypothetical protein HDU96_004236 [Phlyctochytrium bullatum]